MAEDQGITVKKEENMPDWYSQVVLKSEVADYAPIKGCMIIRPLGYSFWQKIMDYFNSRLKKLNVKNAYFPLFIPESFFHKEAEHAEGFSPEVAWIERKDDSQEKLAIRPTSETIMYDAYGKWIRSYRNLPLRMNQWCNIVRWEVQDTKIFLRSREFLWQEGHCVYDNDKQCHDEALQILDEYEKLCKDLLAVPVLKGRKTEKEKFAGAIDTYSIEGFMPDGKALQMGTSHYLGQNFSKAFNIKYIGKDEKKHYGWQNSWGVSTRLIGAMIMQHSDNKGLIIPPRMAENKLVIVPIFFKEKKKVLDKVKELNDQLKEFNVIVDDSDNTPGYKFNHWELKGMPLRLEIGPRDIENNKCVLVRRDNGEKINVPLDKNLNDRINEILDDIHNNLYNNAKKFLEESIVIAKTKEEFLSAIKEKKLVKVSFCGEKEVEEEIKAETSGVTTRNIPLNNEQLISKECFWSGKPAKYNVYFSRNY